MAYVVGSLCGGFAIVLLAILTASIGPVIGPTIWLVITWTVITAYRALYRRLTWIP